MRETKEQQRHEIGVRRLDGTVQVVGSRHAAEDRAKQLNQMARQVGAPETAKVVTRRVTVVTTTTGTEWQEARW